MTNNQSVIEEEVEKFSSLADEWWDPSGPLNTLHAINPTRLEYIRSKIEDHFGSFRENINILDVGCGGGLVTVPLYKIGANITGIDASKNNILAARKYAENHGFDIKYICETAENHQCDARSQGKWLVYPIEVYSVGGRPFDHHSSGSLSKYCGGN